MSPPCNEHFYSKKQLFQVLQVIRRLLIDIVVEPVCIEQRRVAAPVHRRGRGRVVIWKIIIRHLRAAPLLLVAELFRRKGVPVVFRMA